MFAYPLGARKSFFHFRTQVGFQVTAVVDVVLTKEFTMIFAQLMCRAFFIKH